jgi:hypothetical protein
VNFSFADLETHPIESFNAWVTLRDTRHSEKFFGHNLSDWLMSPYVEFSTTIVSRVLITSDKVRSDVNYRVRAITDKLDHVLNEGKCARRPLFRWDHGEK